MVCIIAPYLFPKSYRGFALFPFIFLKYKLDKKNITLINHEKIHLRQQIELLLLPFLFCYFLEFIIRIIQYKKLDKAYRNISFEREAYTNEQKMNYLKNRKFFSFVNYL